MTKDNNETQLTKSFIHTVYSKFYNTRSKFYSWQHLGWIILLVAALNVICIGGKRRAFGIFVAALHSAYNETSMTELNWIGDSYAALGFFLMPFATTVIIRLNRPYRMTMFTAGITIFISCMTSASVTDPSYLFLTHTILHGIGSTLILCGTSLVTGEYFDKTHRFHVLATAFVSGGPYGVLIFGPLFSHWIQDYSWQTAFQFSGVLFLLVTWLGAVAFLPRDMFEYQQALDNLNETNKDEISVIKSKSNQPKTNEPLLLRHSPKASDGRGWAFCSFTHMKNNPQVFLWAVERLLHNIVIYGLLMNLTAYVSQALNNQLILGAKVNLYFGLGESAIFTAGALIGDRIRGHLPLAYFIGALFAALFLLIMQTTYQDINVVYVLAGFTGATIGVGNTFLYATAEEIMLVHGSIAFPMTKMIAGIGMLIAPIFSGAIIDGFGYRGFFTSMAVLVTFRVIFLATICFILNKKKKQIFEATEKEKIHHTNENNNQLYHCYEHTESSNNCQNQTNSLMLDKDFNRTTTTTNNNNNNNVNDLEMRIHNSSLWYQENQIKVP